MMAQNVTRSFSVGEDKPFALLWNHSLSQSLSPSLDPWEDVRTRGDRLGLKEVLEDYEGKGLLAGILKTKVISRLVIVE